jgi:hypothetical protein
VGRGARDDDKGRDPKRAVGRQCPRDFETFKTSWLQCEDLDIRGSGRARFYYVGYHKDANMGLRRKELGAQYQFSLRCEGGDGTCSWAYGWETSHFALENNVPYPVRDSPTLKRLYHPEHISVVSLTGGCNMIRETESALRSGRASHSM